MSRFLKGRLKDISVIFVGNRREKGTLIDIWKFFRRAHERFSFCVFCEVLWKEDESLGVGGRAFIFLGCVVVLRASSPGTSSFWHVGVCCWYSSYPKHDDDDHDDGDDVSGT